MESKEENGINNKEELKNQMLHIHIIMQKFRMIVRIGSNKGFGL